MDLQHLKGELIYLSSPYTHDDPFVRSVRFLESARACAWILGKLRLVVFGAIAHSEAFNHYKLPMEWEFWAEFDTVYINRCKEVWVLCIPGYTNSMGVNAEIKIARNLGRKIVYMIPNHNEENDYTLVEEDPDEKKLYGKVEPGRLGHLGLKVE